MYVHVRIKCVSVSNQFCASVCSCSQFLDNSVLVWETRRPFIPFASFVEHSDDVTGEICLALYVNLKVWRHVFCTANIQLWSKTILLPAEAHTCMSIR